MVWQSQRFLFWRPKIHNDEPLKNGGMTLLTTVGIASRLVINMESDVGEWLMKPSLAAGKQVLLKMMMINT